MSYVRSSCPEVLEISENSQKTPVSESLSNEVEFFSVFHDRVFTTAEPHQVHVTELLNC